MSKGRRVRDLYTNFFIFDRFDRHESQLVIIVDHRRSIDIDRQSRQRSITSIASSLFWLSFLADS